MKATKTNYSPTMLASINGLFGATQDRAIIHKMKATKTNWTPENIIQALINNAKGKLTSRYILGLERALDSVKRGNPHQAIKEQKEWALATKKK